jgi:hypothetical protein
MGDQVMKKPNPEEKKLECIFLMSTVRIGNELYYYARCQVCKYSTETGSEFNSVRKEIDRIVECPSKPSKNKK